MQLFNKTVLITSLMSCSSSLYAWEVNTHQALTRCAITHECKEDNTFRSENLQSFIKNLSLSNKDYSEEIYQDFGKTYKYFAQFGEEAFKERSIGLLYNGTYIDMIEAGSILEDAVYPNPGLIAIADGRFNNHFYDPQQNGKALSHGYGSAEDNDFVDAVTWAITGADLEDDRTNHYSYANALNYYKSAFTEKNPKIRTLNEAKMFVSLGHLLHLLQDMHVPAHVRDDAHGEYDLLEYWARNDNGFNVYFGRFKTGTYDSRIMQAVKEFDTYSNIKINISENKIAQYPRASSFYIQEATFTSNNFLSFGKDIDPHEDEGTDYTDFGTIFDSNHIHPDKSNDVTQDIVEESRGHKKYYFNSNGNTVENIVFGIIDPSKLALGIDYPYGGSSAILLQTKDDKSVMIDNALNLIPRAVGASEAFINYFFRGRMEAKLENGILTIKNISKSELVASPDIVTFQKSVTGFTIYEDSTDGTRKQMPLNLSCANSENLAKDATVSCNLTSSIVNPYDLEFDEKTMYLVFDGDIGDERGISVAKIQTTSIKPEATSETDGITLKWNELPNANGYTICMSESEIQYGDECSENGGKLLPSSTTSIKITEGVDDNPLKDNTTYYFMVKENNEDLWSDQVSTRLTPFVTFVLPANATLDGYKLTATKGDLISFSSSSYFSEYIKESNDRSDEEVTYTLWYVDGETGTRTSTPLTLDAESETFYFVMPSSSITPQDIYNNLNRSSGFPPVWKSVEEIVNFIPSPTNLTATATTDAITLKWDELVDISAYKICMAEEPIADADNCTEYQGGTLIGSVSTQYSVTNNDLVIGNTYYFKVRGIKDDYSAIWSDEVNATAVLAGLDEGAFSNPEVNTEHNVKNVGLDTTDGTLKLSLDGTNTETTFPFIWVANSGEGTISKLSTETGEELGRYRTGPGSGNPSRTTVDQEGNVWVGNRDNNTITKIGLNEWDQCIDRNGNGIIDTSTSGSDVKSWTGYFGDGHGIANAEDECILQHVTLYKEGFGSGDAVRLVAIDPDNNVFAGGSSSNLLFKISNQTAEILKVIATKANHYGGVVDKNGNLWSMPYPHNGKVQKINSDMTVTELINIGHDGYGVTIDKYGKVWTTEYGSRFSTFNPLDPVGTLRVFTQTGNYYAQGVVSDSNGDIFIAGSLDSSSVGQYKQTFDENGNFTGVEFMKNHPVQSGPTGVAVDATGKIWASNYYSNSVSRIDPITEAVDHFSVGSSPYNYSDMTGNIVRTVTKRQGTWEATFDGKEIDYPWNKVSWKLKEELPEGTSVKVFAKVDNSEIGLNAKEYQEVSNGEVLSSLTGQYLKLKVELASDNLTSTPEVIEIQLY